MGRLPSSTMYSRRTPFLCLNVTGMWRSRRLCARAIALTILPKEELTIGSVAFHVPCTGVEPGAVSVDPGPGPRASRITVSAVF
eukprot:3800672-Prymnesium_polylepis.1